MRYIELAEHRASRFARGELSELQGELLYTRYGNYLDIKFPSPLTQGRWELSAKGWVGAFPVDDEVGVVVRPKVPVSNLARMLAHTYDLDIDTFDSIAESGTVDDLYDQLARVLARKILGFVRKGAYHAYRPTSQARSSVRGRLDLRPFTRRGWQPRLQCEYAERTADIVENRIPLWTAYAVLRSGLCSDAVQREVRECYRQLAGLASLVPARGDDCLEVRYNRLSEPYRALHALCRLFLENSGPVAQQGSTTVVPFLLSMPALFERFVAKWLARHLTDEVGVTAQARRSIGDSHKVEFFIDILIYDRLTAKPLCVLDTKYKSNEAPRADDVAQIGYYALIEGCRLAGLVYPTPVAQEWGGRSGQVETFRTTFDISGDLQIAGRRFCQGLNDRLVAITSE